MEQEKRFLLFVVLATLLLIGYPYVVGLIQGDPPPQEVVAVDQQDDAAVLPEEQTPPPQEPTATTSQQAADSETAPPLENPAPTVEIPLARATLGSGDPESGYRMLVTLTGKGAAVQRIELSSTRFRDLEFEGGYIGHLDVSELPEGTGCRVNVVGPGTPAAQAGLRIGDIIREVNGIIIGDATAFAAQIDEARPGTDLKLRFERNQEDQIVTIQAQRKPLEIVRPEGTDPISFLMTLDRVGDQTLTGTQTELPGLDLLTSNWELSEQLPEKITFRRVLSDRQLEIYKRFELHARQEGDDASPGYDFDVSIEIKNTGSAPAVVAYRLDGPTGLPTEGEWYASRISRHGGNPGLRDVVAGFRTGGKLIPDMISPAAILDDDLPDWATKPAVSPLVYLGVDTQYFACCLLPRPADSAQVDFQRVMPLVVSPVPKESAQFRLANTSCRLISVPHTIEPGASFVENFQVFAGPKQPAVLAHYELGELVYFGWFGFVARPMTQILHGFYAIVGNYGIAIILLTVMVRLVMFPLSRKQALNALKMQEIQPEIKRLTEKYKNNPEARAKAQQELFRKHGYNPLSGCLPLFVQLPIFIGLYRALSVDVELRQAPLFWEGFRWCSNLAAPDMLFRWDSWLPTFLLSWLGPYFNLLPIITVALFVVQQKMYMPPPADEQAAMQAKVMQYMMLFMGVLFFKVPSGLCVYFIASSLWGFGERKLMPKPAAAPAVVPAVAGRKS
jgi:YidC/Oxa1 family membrane protein insertase